MCGPVYSDRTYERICIKAMVLQEVAARDHGAAPGQVGAGARRHADVFLRHQGRGREREFFIDNLLIRIHLIIVMISVDRPCAMGV